MAPAASCPERACCFWQCHRGGGSSLLAPSPRDSSSRRKISANCSGTPSATTSAYIARNSLPIATMTSRPSFTPVPIFLSPQPRHVLDAIADVGSRGEADGIYNGLLLLAHSSGMGATPIVLQMNLQADL